MNKIREFIDLTKEDIGYVANLSAIIYIVYVLGKWIISTFFTSSLNFKIGGVILLLVFLWSLVRNAKKLKDSLLYYLELKRQDYYEKREEDIKQNRRYLNFEKIVPQTRVLKYLHQKGEELAKKEFSKDSYLSKFTITISLEKEYKDGKLKRKVAVHSRMEFCSPLKRMSIAFSLRNLKLPKMKNSGLSTLGYNSEVKIAKPFFYDKHWREVVLTVFDRREAELLGEYFFSSVSTSHGDYYKMVIGIMPSGLVKKQYLYFYKDEKLYEDFKEYLNYNKYLPKSASRKLNSIKSFFKFLNNQDLVDKNPAESIKYPTYEAKPPRILTQMEYRALRDAVRNDVRISTVVELLLQTGMRIGELARLELGDIKDNQLMIKAYESQPERNIVLNQSAKKSLDRWVEFRSKTKTKNIFITKTGRAFLVRNIRTIVGRYFKQAEITDATINDLRHTFIAHQLSNGASVVLIQRLVGHKRLSTTEKYLDLTKEIGDEKKIKIEEL